MGTIIETTDRTTDQTTDRTTDRTMGKTRRYALCRVLLANGIPCVCWFEDAIAHYGVPTAVFDLHVLVEDIDAAARLLLDNGWQAAGDQPNDRYSFISELGAEGIPHRRLVLPSPPGQPADKEPNTRTFLYKSTDWSFSTDRLRLSLDRSTVFPRLPDLVDAMIDSWLDSREDTMIFGHLAMQVAYLYEYVPQLKTASFADQLQYEHRQFHYDIPAILTFSLKFARHERIVRQQLRDGTGSLHYDPWNNERDILS